MTSVPTRRGLSALAAVLLLTTSGCGGTGDEKADADSTGSSASASATSSSDAPDDAPASPSASAASGPPITLDVLTMRGAAAPDGAATWNVDASDVNTVAFLDVGATSLTVSLSSSVAIGALPALAIAVEDSESGRGGVRQPDVSVAGEPAYHFAGSDEPDTARQVYGGIHADRAWQIEFMVSGDFPDADAAIASMLASISWNA